MEDWFWSIFSWDQITLCMSVSNKFSKIFLDGYASFLIMHPPSLRLSILNGSPWPQEDISLIQTSSCYHLQSVFRLQTLLWQQWPIYHQHFRTSSAGRKKLLKASSYVHHGSAAGLVHYGGIWMRERDTQSLKTSSFKFCKVQILSPPHWDPRQKRVSKLHCTLMAPIQLNIKWRKQFYIANGKQAFP